MPDIRWKGIIIHHSDTMDDAGRSDWEGIRKFHMSWRHNGESIPFAKVRGMVEKGLHVEAPWRDIGYHFGIEKVNGVYAVQIGRPLSEVGAHCMSKNLTHIGICLLGDYDKVPPTDEQYNILATLCLDKMIQFPGITLKTVEPHSRYSNKTCPGSKFDFAYFQNQIRVAAMASGVEVRE